MSTTMRPVNETEDLRHPSGGMHPGSTATGSRARGIPAVLLALLSLALAGAGIAAVDTPGTARWVAVGVTAAWALAGVSIAFRRPFEPLGTLVAAVGLVVGFALWADSKAFVGGSDTWVTLRAVGILLIPAVGFHLALALPDGRLGTSIRRGLVAVGYLAVIAASAVSHARDSALVVPVAVLSGVTIVVGVAGYADRCRRAGPFDRARLQWAGWGVVVAAIIAAFIWALHALIQLPRAPGAVALAVTALVPLALVLGAREQLASRIGQLLVATIVVGGLVIFVAAVYLVLVIGLGNSPDNEAERTLLALSIAAAALAAVFANPVRERLSDLAHRRVYGERRSPDEALQTFGSRMSRAVPMDELLLQLAETLKTSMGLVAAEVWTGADGALDLVVAVPVRKARRIMLSDTELPVVARAKVSGNAWLGVWVPVLLDGRDDRIVRVAPIAHSGMLLGLIVAERAGDAVPFTEEEERVLTELARQVGLALHNVRLDSALQASLEQLQERNEQLQASRLRIVTAADESRRSIERNLHDGAQQHLVALAVKVGLARQMVSADPVTADKLLEELRADVQATLTELRALAHGIYPPLLRDRGIAEALRTAANRSSMPTDVTADGVGRYSGEVEAAVYFCCLEALQNAGKHAGEGAAVTISVGATEHELRFDVADDGAGFDPAARGESHGFVNMRDRLGAVGGDLDVASSPGHGTHIVGRIPAEPQTADG